MIEQAIRDLDAQAPDHPLTELEADIWARIETRERAGRRSTRILALQMALLVVAFGASALTGRYEAARRSRTSELSVLSPQMPLSVSALLGGKS